jgi:hypothetical protein
MDDVTKKCFSCGEGATHRYEWPWGEHGHTCDAHIAELRGTSARLSRPVEIMPLGAPAVTPPPVLTDETLALRKNILELSAELEDEKRRNAELCDQIERSRAWSLELQATIEKLRGELAQAQQESIIEGHPPTE